MPFLKGASGNPRGRPPRSKPPADPASGVPPGQERPTAIPGQTIHERVVAKLEAILSDPDAEVGHQLSACRLLVSEAVAAVIRHMEHDERERPAAEQMTAADLAAVDGLLADWPAMARETAEEFVADLHAAVTERLPTGSLTEQLRRHLLGLPEPRLTAAEKDAVIREMYGKYGLDYELPKCGFKELPAPDPAPAPAGALPADPDREYLAAQAVERERQRREKIKYPAQALPPPPPPPPPPAPKAPPPEPEPDRRPYVSFPGFDFYVKD